MKIDLSTLALAPMRLTDLEQVVAIEQAVHSHPWNKGNFIDSLTYHHDAWVVRSSEQGLLGYFVQMTVLDEAQLLTIGVSRECQRQGVGLFLLRHVIERAKAMEMVAIFLEVRPSNRPALALYEGHGFVVVGRRKNYYQTHSGQREDALILQYSIGN